MIKYVDETRQSRISQMPDTIDTLVSNTTPPIARPALIFAEPMTVQAQDKSPNQSTPDDSIAYDQFFKHALAEDQEGNAEKQITLAYLYRKGLGTVQDFDQSMFWLQKAIVQAHAPAMTSLAAVYEYGIGVDVDYPRAFEWYKRASELGDDIAQVNLANFYFLGPGNRAEL